MSVKGVKGMSKGMVAKTGMSTSKLEKWDKRYFVLKFRRLFYYKDQAAFRAQNEPRGSCNMRGVVVIPRVKQDGKEALVAMRLAVQRRWLGEGGGKYRREADQGSCLGYLLSGYVSRM